MYVFVALGPTRQVLGITGGIYMYVVIRSGVCSGIYVYVVITSGIYLYVVRRNAVHVCLRT